VLISCRAERERESQLADEDQLNNVRRKTEREHCGESSFEIKVLNLSMGESSS